MTMNELNDSIKDWHKQRKITINGSTQAQMIKLIEELGEVAAGVARNDKAEIKDGLGDMYVVMIAIAELEGLNMRECIQSAYEEIKDRKGYLNEDGVFIKESCKVVL